MKKLLTGTVFAHRTRQKIEPDSDIDTDDYSANDTGEYFPYEAYYRNYHPRLQARHVVNLCSSIKDWQICHGMLLKAMEHERLYISHTFPIGVTLMPSPFPARLYQQARDLQPLYNELYMAVSSNPTWLKSVLQGLIETDPLTSLLWSIYEEATALGIASEIGLGVFRSDYMACKDSNQELSIKQVEMNTIACAGAVHGEKTTKLHRHLQMTGEYDVDGIRAHFSIPESENSAAIIRAIKEAHDQYTTHIAAQHARTCVLMLCQPINFNIADERPIEYGLWSQEPAVPTFRVHWGPEFMIRTELTDDKRLLYRHAEDARPHEVSVIYLRAGFQLHEYKDYPDGVRLRLRVEISKAIKCPPILAHITTLKKVQQSLTEPGTVENFVGSHDARQIRDTFVQMYPLDDSELGIEARNIATDKKLATGHVLKPSLEGGGNNIYKDDIADFVQTIKRKDWHHYILMKLISPPKYSNILLSSHGVHQGEAVCELGIWGTCLWRMPSAKLEPHLEILSNSSAGWSVRTKRADINELSVVKGFGCFDSLHLIEHTESTSHS